MKYIIIVFSCFALLVGCQLPNKRASAKPANVSKVVWQDVRKMLVVYEGKVGKGNVAHLQIVNPKQRKLLKNVEFPQLSARELELKRQFFAKYGEQPATSLTLADKQLIRKMAQLMTNFEGIGEVLKFLVHEQANRANVKNEADIDPVLAAKLAVNFDESILLYNEFAEKYHLKKIKVDYITSKQPLVTLLKQQMKHESFEQWRSYYASEEAWRKTIQYTINLVETTANKIEQQ